MLLRKITSPITNLSKNVCRAVSSAGVPKEEKIKINEYDINYVKAGHGPHHILFLPGALGTIWTEAKPQVEHFNREKFTMVVWDPPGYGKSRPPEKKFTTDFYEKDADMASELMKALNIPKYSVLGFSDGGSTSLIHAAKYQDAVKKLVVWSSNSFILPSELELMYKKKRARLKWEWAGHVTRMHPERWAKVVTNWTPEAGQYRRGRPRRRWRDDLIMFAGLTWPEIARDRKFWKEKGEDFAQQWDTMIHLYPEGTHHIHLKYADDFNQRVQNFLLEP